ncbi:putative methyltransferase [alpha proteobacterium BAL199]|jgi:SAM-dependent methyltransferase|nr:putative methyltransferase [alpha proteobacterium BAL199]
MEGSDPPSIPWRHRIAAWWRGYDAAEYYAWRASSEAPRPSMSMESLIPPMPTLSMVDHAQARTDILQRLFGPGFTIPGGPEHAVAMVKPFGLTPVHSVLDLSAGLGGGATAIVQRFGVWITGYEMDPELAELAPTVVSTLKGGDHVTVRGFSPDSFSLRPKSFDCVVSREAMFGVRDRAALLKEIHAVLKDWGQLVITDYVLPTDGKVSDRVQTWLESEDLTYKPWSKQEYEKAFTALGFDVRVLEERSDEHREQIRDHFARFVAGLDGKGSVANDPAHRVALMAEAERWARRAALLEGGELALYRFFVIKPEPKAT